MIQRAKCIAVVVDRWLRTIRDLYERWIIGSGRSREELLPGKSHNLYKSSHPVSTFNPKNYPVISQGSQHFWIPGDTSALEIRCINEDPSILLFTRRSLLKMSRHIPDHLPY
jgi:hypothetical protein